MDCDLFSVYTTETLENKPVLAGRNIGQYTISQKYLDTFRFFKLLTTYCRLKSFIIMINYDKLKIEDFFKLNPRPSRGNNFKIS